VPSDNEVAEMIERLASRDASEEEFAEWVARHVR